MIGDFLRDFNRSINPFTDSPATRERRRSLQEGQRREGEERARLEREEMEERDARRRRSGSMLTGTLGEAGNQAQQRAGLLTSQQQFRSLLGG